MQILVIIYEFPPVGGGGGQAAKDICDGLVKRGHEVHVLTAHIKGLPRQEILEGVKIYRVPSARRLPYQADMLAMFGFVGAGLVAGLRHIRSWRPDAMHVHFAVPSGPVAWMLHRLTGIPYVLTAHLGDVPEGVPEKTDKWFRWIYPFTPPIWREASRIVAVSEFTRRLAVQHYPLKMQVIYNGVDLARLDPGEIRVTNPPRIAFAGRFMPQKNPILFVQTLGRLKHLAWEGVMLGDGPLRPEVEKEIKALGLEKRISLPGWVSTQEVEQWLAKSDILFMPSRSEGLPVVGVQSLALGLCIVASNIGGFIDLVEPGKNGYLIDDQNADCFANPLEEILVDLPRLQKYREASRQKAQQFKINTVVEAYENLFQDVTHS